MLEGDYKDHLFEVTLPRRVGAGWTWRVVDARGAQDQSPLPTREAALAARQALLRRWQVAARARQGWLWCQTAERWVITLPAACDAAGLPFVHTPCNRG